MKKTIIIALALVFAGAVFAGGHAPRKLIGYKPPARQHLVHRPVIRQHSPSFTTGFTAGLIGSVILHNVVCPPPQVVVTTIQPAIPQVIVQPRVWIPGHYSVVVDSFGISRTVWMPGYWQ